MRYKVADFEQVHGKILHSVIGASPDHGLPLDDHVRQ